MHLQGLLSSVTLQSLLVQARLLECQLIIKLIKIMGLLYCLFSLCYKLTFSISWRFIQPEIRISAARCVLVKLIFQIKFFWHFSNLLCLITYWFDVIKMCSSWFLSKKIYRSEILRKFVLPLNFFLDLALALKTFSAPLNFALILIFWKVNTTIFRFHTGFLMQYCWSKKVYLIPSI